MTSLNSSESASSNAPELTTPDLQPALTHRPGKHCALATFNGRKKVADTELKKALAEVLNCFDQPENKPNNLHILVSINPELIEQKQAIKILPKRSKQYRMPSTQNDALIQVSAMTHTDVIFALRVINSILSPYFKCKAEIFGGQLRYDQEPFGFYHGNNEELNHLEAISKITNGPLAGGSWLLYQLYQQDLPPFYEMSLKEQTNVIGGESVANNEVSLDAIPDTAHTKVAKSPEPLPVMVRRAFPYRKDGVEGTAFIAASNDYEHFSNTLDRMLDRDAMLQFTETLEGGVYFVPPNGEWLAPEACTPALPNDAKYLPLHMKPDLDGAPIALEDYTVAKKFVTYLNTLREYGIFVGPIGEQTFDPDVAVLLQAINDVLAGGELTPPTVVNPDPEKKALLDQLLADSLANANLFNSVAKKYMTLG